MAWHVSILPSRKFCYSLSYCLNWCLGIFVCFAEYLLATFFFSYEIYTSDFLITLCRLLLLHILFARFSTSALVYCHCKGVRMLFLHCILPLPPNNEVYNKGYKFVSFCMFVAQLHLLMFTSKVDWEWCSGSLYADGQRPYLHLWHDLCSQNCFDADYEQCQWEFVGGWYW